MAVLYGLLLTCSMMSISPPAGQLSGLTIQRAGHKPGPDGMCFISASIRAWLYEFLLSKRMESRASVTLVEPTPIYAEGSAEPLLLTTPMSLCWAAYALGIYFDVPCVGLESVWKSKLSKNVTPRLSSTSW